MVRDLIKRWPKTTQQLTQNMLIGNALLRLSVGHYANTGGEDKTLLLHNGQRQQVTTNRREGSRVHLFKAFVQLNGGNLVAAQFLVVV